MGAGQSNELKATIEIELEVEKFGGEIDEGLTEKFYITLGDQEKAMEDLFSLLKKMKEKGKVEYAHKIHAKILFPVEITPAISERLSKLTKSFSKDESFDKLQALRLYELGQKVPPVNLNVHITAYSRVKIYDLTTLIDRVMRGADYMPSSLSIKYIK